jgi:hypothetical protein
VLNADHWAIQDELHKKRQAVRQPAVAKLHTHTGRPGRIHYSRRARCANRVGGQRACLFERVGARGRPAVLLEELMRTFGERG